MNSTRNEIFVKACAYYRNYTLEEVLSPHRLDYVLLLLPGTFFILFVCFLFYSIYQAYGKVNSYLGHNVMRWPITRILFDRLAPMVNVHQSIPPITGYVSPWRLVFKLKTYTWVAKLFTYRDVDVEELAGQDGIRYLHVAKGIVTVLLIPAIGSGIVSGLNIAGGLGQKVPSLWALTTLANLQPRLQLEIFHISLGLFTFLVALVFFIWVGRRNKLFGTARERDTTPATLFISRIKFKDCSESRIIEYLEKCAGGKLNVKQVQLIKKYDGRIEELDEELEVMRETLRRLNLSPNQEYIRIRRCLCCWKKVDARIYYAELEKQLQREKQELSDENDYTGSALVFFDSEEDTIEAFEGMGILTVMAPFLPNSFDFTLSSLVKSEKNPNRWLVSFAPPKDDRDMGNIAVYQPGKYVVLSFLSETAVIVVMVVGALLPPHIIEYLDPYMKSIALLLKEVLILSAKFLWNTGILLVVKNVDSFLVKNPFRSKTHIDVFNRVLLFWTVTEIVMPLLNIIHIETLFTVLPLHRLKCLFRPDVGVEMTKTILIVSCCRNVLSMTRLVHFFLDIYPWTGKTVTEAEVRHSRKSVPMDLGYLYADFIFLYFMAISVALTQPLVPWFALLCMVVRYYVDKHNLCFTYDKSTRDDELHRNVISFLFQPFLIQSCTVLLYSLTHDWQLAVDEDNNLEYSEFTIKSVAPIKWSHCTIASLVYVVIAAIVNVAFICSAFFSEWTRVYITHQPTENDVVSRVL